MQVTLIGGSRSGETHHLEDERQTHLRLPAKTLKCGVCLWPAVKVAKPIDIVIEGYNLGTFYDKNHRAHRVMVLDGLPDGEINALCAMIFNADCWAET